jgi:hypothetical protein
MSHTPSPPTDPFPLLAALSVEQLRQRLEDLAAEDSAVRALLRAALSR